MTRWIVGDVTGAFEHRLPHRVHRVLHGARYRVRRRTRAASGGPAARPAPKSTSVVPYCHVAVSDVASMRSCVSGSVVKARPENAGERRARRLQNEQVDHTGRNAWCRRAPRSPRAERVSGPWPVNACAIVPVAHANTVPSTFREIDPDLLEPRITLDEMPGERETEALGFDDPATRQPARTRCSSWCPSRGRRRCRPPCRTRRSDPETGPRP